MSMYVWQVFTKFEYIVLLIYVFPIFYVFDYWKYPYRNQNLINYFLKSETGIEVF
jgi:hypothetical protein